MGGGGRGQIGSELPCAQEWIPYSRAKKALFGVLCSFLRSVASMDHFAARKAWE